MASRIFAVPPYPGMALNLVPNSLFRKQERVGGVSRRAGAAHGPPPGPDLTTSSSVLSPEAAIREQVTVSDVGVPMYSYLAGSIRTFLSPMALAKISAGLHTPMVLPSGLARLKI